MRVGDWVHMSRLEAFEHRVNLEAVLEENGFTLSSRAIGVLFKLGVETIDDLSGIDRKTLSRIRGCGPDTEREIVKTMQDKQIPIASGGA